MQALKALVIGMAVLIAVGIAILVYGLGKQIGPALDGDGSAAFGTIRASLPTGATVEDMVLDGQSLVVRLARPDGGATLMVFRLSDGRQIGTIELQTGR